MSITIPKVARDEVHAAFGSTTVVGVAAVVVDVQRAFALLLCTAAVGFNIFVGSVFSPHRGETAFSVTIGQFHLAASAHGSILLNGKALCSRL